MVDRAFEEFLGSATATIPGYTWPHEFRGPFLPYPAIHLHHHAARTGRPRDVSSLLYFPPPQTSALWPGGPTEIQPATIPGNHAPPGQFPMQITGRYRPGFGMSGRLSRYRETESSQVFPGGWPIGAI